MAKLVETKALSIADVDIFDDTAVNAFHDAWMAKGLEKVQDDMRRLREMGIIDENGNQLKTITPADMLDPDADFGG